MQCRNRGNFYVEVEYLATLTKASATAIDAAKGTVALVRSEPDLKDADNIKFDERSAHTYGVGLVHVGYGSGTPSGLGWTSPTSILKRSQPFQVLFRFDG